MKPLRGSLLASGTGAAALAGMACAYILGRTSGENVSEMFFSGWSGLVRTVIVGVLAYVTLIVFLRISGKRALSKMNAFDFVVTVALGSTLATILLDENVALAEGALAFALLLALQFLVTWCSVRAHWVRRAVTGEPSLLLYRGRFLEAGLRHTRVTEDEVRAAVRESGQAALDGIEAVVLETDGSLSVVTARGANPAQVRESVLAGVRGMDARSANSGRNGSTGGVRRE